MDNELPVVSVHVPAALRPLVGGQAEIMGSGETVGEVLAALAHRYPHWRDRVFDPDGRLQDGVALYLGSTRISALETPIGGEESLSVLPPGHVDITPGELSAPDSAPPDAPDISIGN